MKKLRKVFKVAFFLYVSGGVVLYFLQDLFIFHPRPLSKNHAFEFDQPFTEQNVLVGEKRNLNIVQFHTKGIPKGIVLYFHGNMRNIERYAQFAPYFTKHNYEVWMIDYPGFGKSTGKFTEQTVYSDALLLYKMAAKKTGASKLIIYGKSLGTGIASFLAANNECRQLILETPYYSMKELAKHYFFIYPSSKLIRYHFPIHEYLSKVTAPVIMFHGTKDEIIPYKQVERLKKENPSAQLITIPAGQHNDLYQFSQLTQKLDSLLR